MRCSTPTWAAGITLFANSQHGFARTQPADGRKVNKCAMKFEIRPVHINAPWDSRVRHRRTAARTASADQPPQEATGLPRARGHLPALRRLRTAVLPAMAGALPHVGAKLDPAPAKEGEPLRDALALLTSLTTPMPEELGTVDRERINFLLHSYHPGLLPAPLVHTNGEPVDLTIDYDDMENMTMGYQSSPSNDQKAQIRTIFEDYPAYKAWLKDNVLVRKIRSSDDLAEPDRVLVGQNGVFATNDLPKNTYVLVFDGMLICGEKDIDRDARVRTMAMGDPGKYRITVRTATPAKVQGMGASMMLNTATQGGGNNLERYRVGAWNQGLGRLQLTLFKTKREIRAGEQLCYGYDVGNIDQVMFEGGHPQSSAA